LLGRAIRACLDDDVPEIRALGRTVRKWWTEILNHHRTGASNGPTEGMNLCVKKSKPHPQFAGLVSAKIERG